MKQNAKDVVPWWDPFNMQPLTRALCSRLGYLQSKINKAKISTFFEASKILHEAEVSSNVTLRFVAVSDASFAPEKTLDSHQGMIIMASHKDIGENKDSPVNPIVWHS